MNRIGFSHGVLYKITDNYTKEAFDIYADSGSEIIEICVAKADETDKLAKITNFVKKYPYKSIHLPTNIKYKNNNATKALLDRIAKFYDTIKADLILVHPNLVENWNIFDDYSLNWAIENMDNRKQSFRGIEDFKNFFRQHDSWKMVLDLNHCYSNDGSMKLADDFINQFKNKITEIHLSGYVDYHEPLYKTKQSEIMRFCKKLDVPIIIESTFDSVDEAKKEINYIKNYPRS